MSYIEVKNNYKNDMELLLTYVRSFSPKLKNMLSLFLHSLINF